MGNLNKVIESMLCLRYDIIYFKGFKKKKELAIYLWKPTVQKM